jgi:hypothetical protein
MSMLLSLIRHKGSFFLFISNTVPGYFISCLIAVAAGEMLRMPGVAQSCDHLNSNYNITPVFSVSDHRRFNTASDPAADPSTDPYIGDLGGAIITHKNLHFYTYSFSFFIFLSSIN